MNLPGMFSPDGLRRPEDPEMTAFLASPEGMKLLEEAAQIERTQMGAPPVPAPANPAAAAPRQPNPFAQLLGSEDATLQSLLGAAKAPPRQGKIDPWDLLMHLGPALMQAGSRPGASFLGSVGEGLGAGMQAAQKARRDSLTQEKEDRLYDLQRAKLGVDIAQSMKKTAKAPTVAEFYDEKTGQPYKAQHDEATGEWRRIGGVKVDSAKAPTVQEFYDEQGRPYKAQYDPATQKWTKVGGAKADGTGKLPEGFRYADPNDPAKGVELIPGYQQGKAALATPPRMPEGYQPIDPADPSKGLRLIPGYLEGKRQVADVLSKPPEGFAFIDAANPAAGVRPLPGYAEGRAQQEALKPFTLPENATRVAPAGTGSTYSQGVRRLENNTGDPAAKNPGSTATGDGQFIEKTWMGLWPQIATDAAPILQKKRIDPATLTPAQILGLRTDPEISAVAIDTYAKQNAPALRQVTGRDPTQGELYLAHFLGADGATQVLRADPSTPIAQIVTGDAYAKNESLLRGHTAGSLRASFDRRMGRGQGVAAAPPPPSPAPAAAPPSAPPGQQNQPQVGAGYQIIAQGAKVPKVDNAYDQTEGKNLAEQRQAIADDAKTGRQTLPLIDTLDGLFQQIGTGKTAPISATVRGWIKSLVADGDLERLGIRDNVGSAEAASALARQVSLSFIQQTKGAISNVEMQIFASMVPNISNTPEGNAILLNAMRAVAKRQVEIEKAARQYESQRGGRIDRGFTDIKDEIFARHPLLPPEVMAAASKPAVSGPGPAPPPRGLAQPAPAAAPPTGTATAAPPAPAPRGAQKSIAPQIRMMDIDTLKQLAPDTLSPEDRKAAADRWEELNRGAR